MLAATPLVDATGSFVVLIWCFSTLGAYLVKSAIRGAATYDRVDKQGGSLVVVKAPMLAYYWSQQAPARWLARIGVKADQLSWSSLVFGGLAGAAFAFGFFGLGCVAFLLSTMCDSLDGLVARETGSFSDAGEVLDSAVDRYVDYLVFAGLVVYYRWSPALELLVVAALAAGSMVTYSSAKAEALGVEIRSSLMRRHDRAFVVIVGSSLAGFSAAYWEGRNPASPSLGIPMVAALCLLAGLGNFAAVRRLAAIAAGVRHRAAAAAGEPIRSGGGVAGEVEGPGVGLVVGHGAAKVDGAGQPLGLDR
jgi:CDP-diacylglycerol---glycerol-3-phosphate 3-phosphatidyltransferase